MAKGVFCGGTGRWFDRRTKWGKLTHGGPLNDKGIRKLRKPKKRKSR
ncbi:hypothetical protein [Acidithrix ferrooxidans]|nr:hypothetical protein [Acidithrix ferrooxidans]